jgi:hypothetical protein
MMAWLLALALPAAVGLILVCRLTPGTADRWPAAPATIGVALGLASVIWSALFFAGIRSRAVLVALDLLAWSVVLAAIVVAVPRVRSKSIAPPADGGAGRLETAAAVTLLIVTASTAVVSFVSASAVFPHGEWDAWAQWNLRARFFFRGLADGSWQQAFDPVLAWSHADYPPLVPLSVARLWTYASLETLLAPIAFAGIVAACTVLAAGCSIARARGAARGCLAAAAILACPSFVRYAPSQCADIALGFFMLAAFVAWSSAEQQRFWLVLAGLSAALAVWTKNEGAAFFVVFVATVAITRLWSAGGRGLLDLVPVLAGAAPILLMVAVFKLTLAPPSYFVAEQTLAQAAANLFDASRVKLVGISMAREIWLSGAALVGVIPFLCAFAAVRGVRADAPAAARTAAPAMAAMIVIYAIAYLVSPKDLSWQLKTSLDRLVVQIVPAMAWSIMTVSR